MNDINEQLKEIKRSFRLMMNGVERLEPSPEERGPGERWSPFFKGKEGDGG